ncbi:ComEC/Rec2 family competence protein [Candidatus Microgenomates bacterium]|nr:ComEC/Rec2 family competence protein [Candidatus Microgenomates bacterium]
MRPVVLMVFIILCLALIGVRFLFVKPVSQKSRQFKPAYLRLTQETNFLDIRIKKLFPYPQSVLLSGIMIGTRGKLPNNLYQQLQITGMLHVIALSGANISFLIASLSFLTGILGKKAANVFICFFIVGFILFVGPSPSVVRAGIMGILLLLAQLAGRPYYPAYALFLSATIMILLNPWLLFDLSFQLSFSATLGIMLFNRPKKTGNLNARISIWRKIKKGIIDSLHITLSAQALTIPLILYNFGQLSLVSFLTNVLCGWLIGYILSLGFLVVLFSFLSQSLGMLLTILVLPFLNIFLTIVKITSMFPFASLRFSAKTVLVMVVIYYLLLITVIYLRYFHSGGGKMATHKESKNL